MKTFPLLLAATVIGATLPLHAALDSSLVAADARWMIQANFNELRDSAIGKQLIEACAKNQPPIADGAIKIDFQKLLATVGRATAYGTSFSHNPKEVDGTLIIEGTPDLRKIAEGYVAQALVSTPDKITEAKEVPFECYIVGGDLYVGFPKEPIILVSKSKAQLQRAHELFTKHAASLAKAGDSPLRKILPDTGDSFLVAASLAPTDGTIPDNSPHARLLKMATAGSVEVGEENQQTFAHVKLLASSDEMADKLMKIAQGITAMLSLTETNDKQLEEFLHSVNVERRDQAVLINLSYSSQRLVEMFNHVQEEHHQTLAANGVGAGKVIAEWKADKDLPSSGPDETSLTIHTISNIHLVSGSVIWVNGFANHGEHARLDYVEVVPVQGGQPLKFEAEYMKLVGYQIENVPAASGGKLVMAHGLGIAEFQFPGATGDYNMNVRYCDENDGVSRFTIRVQEPKPATPAP